MREKGAQRQIHGRGDKRHGRAERVNINTASEEELAQISEIGRQRARQIVEHRRKNGRFSSVDELLGVEGLANAKMESLRASLTV